MHSVIWALDWTTITFEGLDPRTKKSRRRDRENGRRMEIDKETINQCEIKKVANECLWLFHCTVLTNYSFADELKPPYSVSKDG